MELVSDLVISSRVCFGTFPCQHGSQISNPRCSGPLGWCFALDVAHVGGRHGLSFPHLEGYRYSWKSFKLPVAFGDTYLRWSQAPNALVQQVPLKKSHLLCLFLKSMCCKDWNLWIRQAGLNEVMVTPSQWARGLFWIVFMCRQPTALTSQYTTSTSVQFQGCLALLLRLL